MIIPFNTQRHYFNTIVLAKDENGGHYTWYIRGDGKTDELRVTCEKFINAYSGSSPIKVEPEDIVRVFDYTGMDITKVSNLDRITKAKK